MPARFDKLGISFQYPDNWTLDDSDALLGRKSVTVYSPGGAFWTVAIHAGSADPAKLAAGVLDAMKKEYPGLEIDEAFEMVAGHDLVGYDLAFYYLDLINTALIRSLRVGQTSYTIFCQAEDREFDHVRLVFQAMTTSLVSSLKEFAYEGWEEDGEG
ncbi:MAG: hypothetical protein WCB27_24510 [Thermoguttaceae bacterium]